MRYVLIAILVLVGLMAEAKVSVGVDVLFEQGYDQKLFKGKRVGLITNHTAINGVFQSTLDVFYKKTRLTAIFAPEHGITGLAYASESVTDQNYNGIPIYSLHGNTRRPTTQMFKNVEVLVYDIQDIGSRSYTFCSTLFYCMEEAAKHHIPVVVLDRPNPINGIVVDGPMLDQKWRSFVGYINVPYCHGMTIGELAHFFNEEYHIQCQLTVVPMSGWKRWMSFKDTGLFWIPTSPQIPEDDTPYYYPVTGLLGELSLVNIGVGYTLPFKIAGAPWIDAKNFSTKLNQLQLPGVVFQPFHFRPFFGKFIGEDCQGVRIIVTDQKRFLPLTTQTSILGMLKSLYPTQFKKALADSASRKEMFIKVCGTDAIYQLLAKDEYIIWKMREICQKDLTNFLSIRKKYLLPEYNLGL